MALLSSLRNIYDSVNKQRIVVGFDTFEGYPNISIQDGNSSIMKIRRVSVPLDYQNYLNIIFELHNKIESLGHLKKFEICISDAIEDSKVFY